MPPVISQDALGGIFAFDPGEQARRGTQGKAGVFHIEDDSLWSGVTAHLLGQWPEVCHRGTASTGMEGVAQCRVIMPAIVLLDLVLPDMSGFAVWDQLSALSRPPKILLLTCRADEALLHRLLIGGIAGLIWKKGDFVEHLRPALAAVAAGGSYFPSEVEEAVRRFRASPDAFHKVLSPWELKLVTMLGLGRKDGDIADEIGCSRGTIRNHWRNIAVKLGLGDRHELRLWAERKGFSLESTSDSSAKIMS